MKIKYDHTGGLCTQEVTQRGQMDDMATVMPMILVGFAVPGPGESD
jgi:hypothetical protein